MNLHIKVNPQSGYVRIYLFQVGWLYTLVVGDFRDTSIQINIATLNGNIKISQWLILVITSYLTKALVCSLF